MARTKQTEKQNKQAKEVEPNFDRKYTAKEIDAAKKGQYYFLVGRFDKSGNPEEAYIGGAPGRFEKDEEFVFYRPMRLAGNKQDLVKYFGKHHAKKDYNLDNDDNLFTAANTRKANPEDGTEEGSQRGAYDEERAQRRKIAKDQDGPDDVVWTSLSSWLEEIRDGKAKPEERPKKTKKSKSDASKGGARRHPLYTRLEKADTDEKVLDVSNYTADEPNAKMSVPPGDQSSKIKLNDYPIVASYTKKKNLRRFLKALKDQASEASEDDSSVASKYASLDIDALMEEFSKAVSNLDGKKSTKTKSSSKSSKTKSSKSVKEEEEEVEEKKSSPVPVVGRKNLASLKPAGGRIRNIQSPK